jgi:hypothetical protein
MTVNGIRLKHQKLCPETCLWKAPSPIRNLMKTRC